jgi:hypothetical protein
MRIFCFAALAACSGTQEAATVELPVTTSSTTAMAATTDLGYQVQLSRLRIAVDTIQFTIEGEVHGDDEVSALVRPHPGHAGGGEVTGELPGSFVLEWNGQEHAPLGIGELITGDYYGANFAIRAASASDGLAADDPLLGHAFHFTGTISKDGVTKSLDGVLDVEVDTAVIGAVFDDVITKASTETLAIQFFAIDPFEDDTAFDGVDYFQGVTGDAIQIRPGDVAHNIIRRVIATHDHFGVTAR